MTALQVTAKLLPTLVAIGFALLFGVWGLLQIGERDLGPPENPHFRFGPKR